MRVRPERYAMRSEPGTYLLILESGSSAEIQIGRWGALRVRPGFYSYVGSAFGPGGVRARVSRHLRRGKKNRWHIDHLREVAEPVSVRCSYAPFRLEHDWARAFGGTDGFSCIKGFGSSDCRCKGHLFFTSAKPEEELIRRAIGGAVESIESER